MQMSHVYAFTGGAFVGRFGGIISSAVVTLTLLYIIDPTIFININVDTIKEGIINLLQK